MQIYCLVVIALYWIASVTGQTNEKDDLIVRDNYNSNERLEQNGKGETFT